MKLCLTFVLLISLASAFVLQEEEPKRHLWVGSRNDLLKFDNYSGPGATSKHITSFIKYANDATSLYKDNMAANLNYIKQMMDINFGTINGNFLVMIQTNKTTSSYFVWIDDDQLYASLSRINKVYPEWSYLFVKVDVVEIGPDYVIITEG